VQYDGERPFGEGRTEPGRSGFTRHQKGRHRDLQHARCRRSRQGQPDATCEFEGSSVYAYVWPTSLDSSNVDFYQKQGIVALAVILHPDFDDAANSGRNWHKWHPHWVVLAEDEACPGGLKVVDTPKGATPKVPKTWPGVPLLIDSPDYSTTLKDDTVDVEIPLSLIGGIKGASFDGVTVGLKVNGNLHAPLLCVSNVFKVASGNLSLPGKVDKAKCRFALVRRLPPTNQHILPSRLTEEKDIDRITPDDPENATTTMAGDRPLAPEMAVSEWFNTPKPLTLSGLRGRPVFFHSFQLPCPGWVSKAIPQIRRIEHVFGHTDLQIIGLHTVFDIHAAMAPVNLKAFLHEYRITTPIAVDKGRRDIGYSRDYAAVRDARHTILRADRPRWYAAPSRVRRRGRSCDWGAAGHALARSGS